LNAWRNRPLGEIKYLIIDARYEKVRRDNQDENGATIKMRMSLLA